MCSSDVRCNAEAIVAYVDGDLDHFEQKRLEDHVRECEHCRAELRQQRLLLSELDSFLTSAETISVPRNFARVVATAAESDMSGARDGAEQKRALGFCLVLGLAAFAMLGAAATGSVLTNIWLLLAQVVSVLDLFWTALRDAAIGLIVIMRVISQGILPDSHWVLTALSVLLLAVILLSLLISSYHRYRRLRLWE